MRQSRKSNRIAQMEKTASFYAYISNECVDTVALLGCRILGRKQCVQANNDPGGMSSEGQADKGRSEPVCYLARLTFGFRTESGCRVRFC